MSMEAKVAERILRIFCAVLMLSLGFAHKPAFAGVSSFAAYGEEYRLPDGSFAEICADHSTGEAAGHGDGQHPGYGILFCEACLLASSILVSAPDDGCWLSTGSFWLENRLVGKTFRHSVSATYSPNARAPPVIVA